MIKIKSGFYSKSDQNGKTKAVVWNAIWTAMKPEKKIWAAEIEIYLLVMSNGLSGIRKIWKWSVCFRLSDRFGIAMLLTANYFNVLVFRKALKAQISCSKIDFGSKFRQKHFFDIFSIFSFFSFFNFFFSHFDILSFSPKIIFDFTQNHIFFDFLSFWYQIPPHLTHPRLDIDGRTRRTDVCIWNMVQFKLKTSVQTNVFWRFCLFRVCCEFPF